MIYFDNASTTKISKSSLEAYNLASESFYNPSALYEQAAEAKKEIEQARQFFLNHFKAPKNATFLFTGSATESNNAVLNSHITRKDKKYLISSGEHSSVYSTAKQFKDAGYNVVFLPLKRNGEVNIDALKNELDENVVFVSIIHVSNETGVINDIEEITTVIKNFNKNIIVHSDGVQAVGKINIDLKRLGVDYYTISAHKIHGPKGIGGLYIANPNKFKPFILGGGQEMGLRSGTENLPAIMGFKTALGETKLKDFSKHKKELLEELKGEYICLSGDNCVDNIISLGFKGVRGETILHILEDQGYLIGTGSACNSKAGVNRVVSLLAPKEYVEGAVRISFGEEVSIEDCRNLGRELTKAVKQYREKTRR